jgi:DNA-binding Lrp family transcriptional regulator
MDARLSDAVFSAPAAPTLGGPGPLAPVPATPKVRTARVRVTSEAVGVRGALGGYYRSLPPWIDDLTREFGPETYERMQLDDQVSSSLRALCHGVLSDDLVLRPAVDDDKDPDFAAAKDAVGFCERATWGQTGGLDQWLLTMLKGAVGGGNRVSETVCRPEESGRDAGRWVPDRLKVKPRRSIAFAVDNCNNLAGFLALAPGSPGWGGLAWGTAFDPADPPDNFLPREKFCVLSWDPPDEDPRGSSILRCVYEPWWAKLQAAREWLAYLAQFGSPGLVGTTAEGADSSAPTDADGNPVPGDVLTPEQDMANKVMEHRNGGVHILPHGATLDVLQSSNAGDAFLKKVDSCDRAIAQGINLAMRAVMQSRFGSRADAEQGQDVAGLQTRFLKRWLARMVTEDLLRPLVRINYGPDAARRLCPYASLSPVEHQDLGPSLVAVSGAWKNGLIKNSQLPWVYEQFGMPPATEEELAAPPPGSVPPGAPGGPGGGPGGSDDGSGDAQHPLAQALLAQGPPGGGSAPFADDAGGHWVTLEDGQHVFIGGGGGVLATRGQISGGAGADSVRSALAGAKPRTVDQLAKATGLSRDEVLRRMNVLLGQGRLEKSVVKGKAAYKLKAGPGDALSATSPAKKPVVPAAGKGAGFPADDAPRKFDEGAALTFEKSQRPFLNTVTRPERDAVRAYTSSLYDEVNGSLRAGTPLEGRAAEVVGHLDAVFARAPRLAEPVTCYRGIALSPADAAEFQRKMAAAAASGSPVTMPGFSSTSLDPGQAGRFGGKDDGAETFFEVRARHGLAVQPLTSYRTEHEFLLPRSARFRVHGLKDVEVVNGYGESRRVKVIQVEQL